MTVLQLKKAIEHLPDNMQVFVTELKSDFVFSLAESAKVKKIGFGESPDSKILAEEDVLVIED